MSYRLAALLAPLLAAAAAAQVSSVDHQRALEPAADDLARLNLVTAWRLYLPVDQPRRRHCHRPAVRRPGVRSAPIRRGCRDPGARGPEDLSQGRRRDLDVPPGAARRHRPPACGRTDGGVRRPRSSVDDPRPGGREAQVHGGLGVHRDRPPRPWTTSPCTSRSATGGSSPTRTKPRSQATARPSRSSTRTRSRGLASASHPAEALSTPQNRSPSIAMLETVRPPFFRNVDTIDSSPSIGMLKTLRPPYREVDISSSPVGRAAPEPSRRIRAKQQGSTDPNQVPVGDGDGWDCEKRLHPGSHV